MRFEFIIRDDDGNVIFAVDKPTLEMMEEEIGRWERHFAKKYQNEQEPQTPEDDIEVTPTGIR